MPKHARDEPANVTHNVNIMVANEHGLLDGADGLIANIFASKTVTDGELKKRVTMLRIIRNSGYGRHTSTARMKLGIRYDRAAKIPMMTWVLDPVHFFPMFQLRTMQYASKTLAETCA